MPDERLKLGKGASFFVKSHLRRLRQEGDTWEADFFPIPCSDSEHDSVWWGIALSHDHDTVLAQRLAEEPPTVNDPTGQGACTFESGQSGPNYCRTRSKSGSRRCPRTRCPSGAVPLATFRPRSSRPGPHGHLHPGERIAMPGNTDNSARAFQELVRVLEEAVRAGVASVGLEYTGRDLIVFHNVENDDLGAPHISQELQQAVIEELGKRAGLSREPRGKMQVSPLGKDYEAVVEEYDSFGEAAFTISLRERKKQAGRWVSLVATEEAIWSIPASSSSMAECPA